MITRCRCHDELSPRVTTCCKCSVDSLSLSNKDHNAKIHGGDGLQISFSNAFVGTCGSKLLCVSAISRTKINELKCNISVTK